MDYWIRVLVSIMATLTMVAAKRIPLKGERERFVRQRTPGCRLGGKFYPLRARWSPSLEPIGVMYCVLCECQPIERKGVTLRRGRVMCRNVKNDCPEVTCQNPILPRDQCCKYCPGQGPPDLYGTLNRRKPPNGYIGTDSATPRRVQQSEFMSLMIGKSELTAASTFMVARGRFTLKDTTLTFTVTFSRLIKPRYLRFTDDQGNILHEYDLHKTNKKDYMICGEWRNIGYTYVKYLHDVKMHTSIVTSQYPQGEVGGRVEPHRALSTETFTALMEPDSEDGSGGVAMVTMNEKNNEVNFIIRSVGLLKNSGRVARVAFERRKGRQLMETTIPKDRDIEEFTGLWSGVSSRLLRQMARGKLSIAMATEEGKILRGKLTPRLTCNVLQAVLSGAEAYRPTRTGGAGGALVQVLPNGRIKFEVDVAGLVSPLNYLTIEAEKPKTGRAERLCKISRTLNPQSENFTASVSATCKRADALQLHRLLLGQMYLNLGRQGHSKSVLRGRLTELLYDAMFQPRSENNFILAGARDGKRGVTTEAGGVAWLSIKDGCTLHYQVVTSGYERSERGSVGVFLKMRSINYDIITKRTDYVEKLGDLTEGRLLGQLSELSENLYRALGQGTAILVVATKARPTGEISAQVEISNKCYKLDARRPSINDILDDTPVGGVHTNGSTGFTGCKDNGRLYQLGDSWIPKHPKNSCSTCSCKNGQVVCHDVQCPRPKCDRPVKVPGDCCPQCIKGTPSKEKCFFNGDKRWHTFGTLWHPYVPPFGYVECAICSCSRGNSPYNCTRITCPPLDCPESMASRKNGTDCCKSCPKDYDPRKKNSEKMLKDRTLKYGNCKFRGLEYPNGARWNPRVEPFGTLKCVTCLCRKGKARCQRTKCPKLACKRKVQISNTCCPICAEKHGGNRKKIRRRTRSHSKRG